MGCFYVGRIELVLLYFNNEISTIPFRPDISSQGGDPKHNEVMVTIDIDIELFFRGGRILICPRRCYTSSVTHLSKVVCRTG